MLTQCDELPGRNRNLLNANLYRDYYAFSVFLIMSTWRRRRRVFPDMTVLRHKFLAALDWHFLNTWIFLILSVFIKCTP